MLNIPRGEFIWRGSQTEGIRGKGRKVLRVFCRRVKNRVKTELSRRKNDTSVIVLKLGIVKVSFRGGSGKGVSRHDKTRGQLRERLLGTIYSLLLIFIRKVKGKILFYIYICFYETTMDPVTHTTATMFTRERGRRSKRPHYVSIHRWMEFGGDTTSFRTIPHIEFSTRLLVTVDPRNIFFTQRSGSIQS